MKRNWDVIVDLLKQFEDRPASATRLGWWPRVDGVGTDEVREHLVLAHDAGLVDYEFQTGRGWKLSYSRLTNAGHDFLEAMRTPSRRQKMIEWAEGIGKALTVELVLASLRSLSD